MFELVFRGNAPQESETMEAPTAEFVLNGNRKIVKGFYDGDNAYKIRYYPQSSGQCVWNVTGNMELEGDLTGEEPCLPAEAGRHGMVRTNGIHFRYEDGTRYTPFGTTVYAMIHQEKSLVEETFKTLGTAPFNKVRLCVFPKDYDYNHNEPENFAFQNRDGHFDVKSPDFSFWRKLEEAIERLERMGIEADLILFHPYDRWGFAALSKEECLTYLDYTARRLSAYPNVWWSLANEFDLMEHFEEAWWYEFARFLHDRDAYGHLLSNHNSLPYWDFSDENITHCCIQDSRMKQIPNLQEQYQKPVVFDECCYEGNIGHPWGNISGFELVNRFWMAYTVGGYCSHGETFLDENEILWWAKGGVLHGESPERIAFLRAIMEELPGDLDAKRDYMGFVDIARIREDLKNPEKAAKISAFEKALTKMPENRLPELIDRFREVQGHCGEKAYLKYLCRQCAAEGSLNLPDNGAYDVEVIDVWEMTREKVLSHVNGKVMVKLPGKEGIAILAKRVSGEL